MTEIDITAVKIAQSLRCKCGRAVVTADVAGRGDSIEIICMACHSSLLEIRIDLREGPSWD